MFPNFVSAANLIHSLDFEAAGWETSFRSGAWQGKIARVNNTCHGGDYCLRGNLMLNKLDPITGLLGVSNPQLEYVGNNISSQTPNEIFISYWRRFDGATWQGTMVGHGKGEYLTDDIKSTTAYYTRMAWGPNDSSFVGNGAWPQSWDTENWGYIQAYLGNPLADPGGSDGQWHKFDIYVNYIEHYVSFWIDGYKLLARGTTASYIFDGKVPVYPDFHLRGLQLLYVDQAEVNQSIDGTGYACGYQFDDIQVWDGMPTADVIAPSAPTGLGVN
ncbi:MAG: hypothetical protein HGA36_03225 [Candidatus Moranbacteria bacterium]|nr:hypothetical protein [Candidatus Moranbacteria bacterium]